ncbi:MAG: M1 family peptidase, partial [Flavobacteriales bacterium]|nr:M1 family peptidase [Flavobacteriales bacterium]
MKTRLLTLAFAVIAALCMTSPANAQQEEISRTNTNVFRQLRTELPTPNVYRTASGAPGHEYWQQQVDYDMHITLDDNTQRIDGSETITYTNNSPDVLRYLWVQLDQNVRSKDSDSHKIGEDYWGDRESFSTVNKLEPTFEGGFNIESVKDVAGKTLSYTINKTMMRVDLPRPLKSGGVFKFSIDWWYNINNRMEIGGRSGYEHFEENDNYLYTIAQFFPRLAVYSDNEGWQNKQFL